MAARSSDPPATAPDGAEAESSSLGLDRGSEPAAAEPEPPEPEAEGVDALLRRYLSLPPVRISPRPPPPSSQPVDRAASTAPPSGPESVPAKSAPVALADVDVKLAEIEPLLKQTHWGAVADLLSKQETLSPPLALLYAVALRERDTKGRDPERIAIRAVAALLCVPEESETALVVAKRILRRNPVGWQKRPAPSARVSFLIIAIVLLAGAAVGFLLGPGGFVLQ